jgi:predicted transcriptional regulator
MSYMAKGWAANLRYGSVVYINGSKACNLSTIEALVKAGLIQSDGKNGWKATEQGREFYRK